MGITKKSFGTCKCGKEVTAFTITNDKGMSATVINYGAILTELIVPNKNGKVDDVVLGYDTLEPYYENGSFFGATVGRSANRIKDAKFEIDGVTYQLDVNDGPNNLHSHFEDGFHKRFWEAKEDEGSNAVTFFLTEEDGTNGFPGTLDISVTYRVSPENELSISYAGECDKKTLINCTNHTYFNLSGHDSGNIHDHKVQINAGKYTPVVQGAIPTGECADVAGTPFDLRNPKRVGDEVDSDNEQLKLVHGYDHNFCVDNYDGNMKLIAKVIDDSSKREMEVYSDLPGVQFYAGNCIGDTIGKNGTKYTKRSGLCLETQYFPNSINDNNFISPVFGDGKPYMTSTIYKFV